MYLVEYACPASGSWTFSERTNIVSTNDKSHSNLHSRDKTAKGGFGQQLCSIRGIEDLVLISKYLLTAGSSAKLGRYDGSQQLEIINSLTIIFKQIKLHLPQGRIQEVLSAGGREHLQIYRVPGDMCA